jgi:hypothetical protein
MASQKCLLLQILNAISAAQAARIITEKSTLAESSLLWNNIRRCERKQISYIIFLIKGIKLHTSDSALNMTLYAKRILVGYCYCNNQTSKRK